MEQTSLYGSTRLQLADPLHLLLGGKFSWLKYRSDDGLTGKKTRDYEQKHEFTPYAGLVYDLNDQWSVYTSYARHLPAAKHLRDVLRQAAGSIHRRQLRGGRQGRTVRRPAEPVRGRVRRQEIRHGRGRPGQRGQLPGSLASTLCYRNGGTLRSKGFELEASGELAPGWQLMAGYTFVTSRDDEGETISAETPRHLFRLSTNYQLPGRWNAFSIGGGVSAQSGYSYRPMTTRPCAWARPDARCGPARGVSHRQALEPGAERGQRVRQALLQHGEPDPPRQPLRRTAQRDADAARL